MGNMLKVSDVWPGDVLICRGSLDGVSKGAWARQEIASATNSPYTHAAIALRDAEIADARPAKGVCIRPLEELINESDYIAVFRPHPGLWNSQSLSALHNFTNTLRSLEIGYNHRPFWKWLPMPIAERKVAWEKAKDNHQTGIQAELQRYFDEGPPAASNPNRPYFCSELVVACFTQCGPIDPSAYALYKPEVFAPGDLPNDPTFGLFVGFICSNPNKKIPDDDPHLHSTTYHQIYP